MSGKACLRRRKQTSVHQAELRTGSRDVRIGGQVRTLVDRLDVDLPIDALETRGLDLGLGTHHHVGVMIDDP